MAKLLLVDTGRGRLPALVNVLSGDGHDVHTLDDGRQVVALTHRLRPDVVLIVVGPPSLDGIDLCREGRVATMVAIAFAASWKPLTSSNTRPRTITVTRMTYAASTDTLLVVRQSFSLMTF